MGLFDLGAFQGILSGLIKPKDHPSILLASYHTLL